MASIFNQDFREFIDCLNIEKVRYILVGGYSVILHGYSRTTGDLDIWVEQEPDNYTRLQKAFERFKMPVFDMTMENFMHADDFDVFSFGRPPIAIDIMTAVKGLDFTTCYKQLQEVEVDGINIKLIHLQHLLKAKKAAGRPKYQDDIEHLTND